MPSKKEGFGIVFIEAMHYGLPVIAGSIDGSADALCNGRLGVLVNPDDQVEINNALQKVIAQKEKYLPNRELLMQHFSYAAYKSKLSQLVHTLFSLAGCIGVGIENIS
jgi:glycosyltransferase involved in cell wall biosynthesis